jgi:hypothetical protein
MLDAGCWMLDAGCWMLDARFIKSTKLNRVTESQSKNEKFRYFAISRFRHLIFDAANVKCIRPVGRVVGNTGVEGIHGMGPGLVRTLRCGRPEEGGKCIKIPYPVIETDPVQKCIKS